MGLQIGDRAPEFTLAANGRKTISLADFSGKKVVLYFYPKDMTPGCTIEANDFSALSADFEDTGTVVIGVSKDSPERHDKFSEKHDLKIHLVSDTEGTLCDAYQVWKEKSMYGRSFMGIIRSTFLIDEKGVIEAVWPKVKVKGHAAEVLEKARS
ncbi:MAG: thioredoxin-dependent thiol peroxidase [Alphaproteobacteria bacterium]